MGTIYDRAHNQSKLDCLGRPAELRPVPPQVVNRNRMSPGDVFNGDAQRRHLKPFLQDLREHVEANRSEGDPNADLAPRSVTM